MSYRSLREISLEAPEAFYLAALKYGHFLWLAGHSGRSILALTRALYTDLDEASAVLEQWPLPYTALHWIIAEHRGDDFPGNPRVSFQHQATRIEGPRRELRRARAWAVWALIRDAKPSLLPDGRQKFTEPSLGEIEHALSAHGSPAEATQWRRVLDFK